MAAGGNDYQGVDPIYQNYANTHDRPVQAPDGTDERAIEDRSADANAQLAAQSLQTGVLGHRGSGRTLEEAFPPPGP